MLLQGDLSQFDELAVVVRLALHLPGVNATQISLNVTAASVRVAATIHCASITASEEAAGDARELLLSWGQVEGVFGMPILQVEQPPFVAHVIVLDSPSSPMPSPPPPPPPPSLLRSQPPSPPPSPPPPPYPPLQPSPSTSASVDSQNVGLAEFGELAIVIASASVAAVLLLLLGYCLRTRWLRGNARAQIERGVHGGPESNALEEGMAGSAEAVGAEPWPELVVDSRPKTSGEEVDSPLEQTTRRPFKQDRVKGSALTSMRLFQPMRLPGAGSSNGMLSKRVRKTVTAPKETVGGLPVRQCAYAAPPTTPEATAGASTITPATGCGACTSVCHLSTRSDTQSLSLEDLVEAGPRPSMLPQPTPTLLCQKAMSQGKLAELVPRSRVSAEKAARFRAHRASIRAAEEELNVMFAGAKGTKEAPGRCDMHTRPAPTTGPSDQGASSASSSHHGTLAAATNTVVRQTSVINPATAFASRGRTPSGMSPEAAHMAANIRSALGCDAGSNNSSGSGDGSEQTKSTASDSNGPPDTAACSPNSDRRRVLQGMHTERAQLSRARSTCLECRPGRETSRPRTQLRPRKLPGDAWTHVRGICHGLNAIQYPWGPHSRHGGWASPAEGGPADAAVASAARGQVQSPTVASLAEGGAEQGRRISVRV